MLVGFIYIEVKMKVHIDVFGRDDIVDEHRYIFAEMLKKQGKVRGDLTQKTDRCCFISIAKINDKTIAIGAIKQKTASDFHPNKANLENLSSQFSWELGYIYTDPEYRGKGLAKKIVTSLLSAYGDDNLMASTELEKNPGMVSILKEHGFIVHGKSWPSSIHGNALGLFLRFK